MGWQATVLGTDLTVARHPGRWHRTALRHPIATDIPRVSMPTALSEDVRIIVRATPSRLVLGPTCPLRARLPLRLVEEASAAVVAVLAADTL